MRSVVLSGRFRSHHTDIRLIKLFKRPVQSVPRLSSRHSGALYLALSTHSLFCPDAYGDPGMTISSPKKSHNRKQRHLEYAHWSLKSTCFFQAPYMEKAFSRSRMVYVVNKLSQKQADSRYFLNEIYSKGVSNSTSDALANTRYAHPFQKPVKERSKGIICERRAKLTNRASHTHRRRQ